jgi:tetraacyldisaccharide 4'-kinase
MRRPPRFWETGNGGAAAALLAPAAQLYSAAVRLRFALARPVRVPVPVVCVGNPGLGGAGKTPTALAIARRLAARGHAPWFLSRGYGGRLAGPLRVDAAHHAARDVGDEPLLLAASAPTVVARDRVAGARHAAAAGAGVIVMDDGYQNPSLAKDCAILVVDGAAGIGNGRVFPAGPLRERLGPQLARARLVVIVGKGVAGDRMAVTAGQAGIAVLRAALCPTDQAPPLAGRAVVAFCGIARPEKFFASLEAAGARVAATLAFPDHHPFTTGDAARILELAARHAGAMVLTTEKDRVRLDAANDPGAKLRGIARALPVEMVFEEPAALDALLAASLGLEG